MQAIEIPTVKVYPWLDIAHDEMYLAVFIPIKREFMLFKARENDTVTLPAMGKGQKERKVTLQLFSKHTLKERLTLLRSPKPEKFRGMNRYLTESEKLAIRQGILCVLDGEAPEIARRDADE